MNFTLEHYAWNNYTLIPLVDNVNFKTTFVVFVVSDSFNLILIGFIMLFFNVVFFVFWQIVVWREHVVLSKPFTKRHRLKLINYALLFVFELFLYVFRPYDYSLSEIKIDDN